MRQASDEFQKQYEITRVLLERAQRATVRSAIALLTAGCQHPPRDCPPRRPARLLLQRCRVRRRAVPRPASVRPTIIRHHAIPQPRYPLLTAAPVASSHRPTSPAVPQSTPPPPPRHHPLLRRRRRPPTSIHSPPRPRPGLGPGLGRSAGLACCAATSHAGTTSWR